MTNANTIQTSKQNGNPHELSCHKILYDSQYVMGTKQSGSQDIIRPSQNVAGAEVKTSTQRFLIGIYLWP